MAKWNQFYLIRIEFLGFRYHGWQKQRGVKTVHGMIDKTMPFVLGHEDFKTLGSGRTDSMVSANDFVFELFLNEDLNLETLKSTINKNLPSDIRVKTVERTNAEFNIIQHSKIKEYHYHFSFGEKTHPFSAPFICCFEAQLNIAAMILAAKEFEGTHNFKRFTSKPSPKTIFEREIISAHIEKNNDLTSNFFPTDSYVFKVRSKGFLRYQVRLMMHVLLKVGQGDWSIEDLKESLVNFEGEQITSIAPASGLCLFKTEF